MSELLLKYAKGIPKDLWYIFIPETVKGLRQLEANLLFRELNRRARRAAYASWKNGGLALKYRRHPLRRLNIMIAILKLKEKKKWKDSDNFEGGDIV